MRYFVKHSFFALSQQDFYTTSPTPALVKLFCGDLGGEQGKREWWRKSKGDCQVRSLDGICEVLDCHLQPDPFLLKLSLKGQFDQPFRRHIQFFRQFLAKFYADI